MHITCPQRESARQRRKVQTRPKFQKEKSGKCVNDAIAWREQEIKARAPTWSVFNTLREGGAPFLEALQYQVDAWSGWGKPLFHLPAPKSNLIYGPRVGDVSDIKLIRTDTTLDLSQKAEKRY